MAGGLFWLFPLVHVVRLNELEATKRQAAFNAAEFVKSFWDERLSPSLDQAADASAVLAALHDDPQTARAKVGRTVGVSRKWFVVLRGSGTIVSLENAGVGVALKLGEREPDIILQTGLLFGNTVRDATGALDASDFANSQHFNDVSTELNQIVESRVIPTLKEQAAVDRQVEFIGCAEVSDDASDVGPLKVIPLRVSIK